MAAVLMLLYEEMDPFKSLFSISFVITWLARLQHGVTGHNKGISSKNTNDLIDIYFQPCESISEYVLLLIMDQ